MLLAVGSEFQSQLMGLGFYEIDREFSDARLSDSCEMELGLPYSRNNRRIAFCIEVELSVAFLLCLKTRSLRFLPILAT